MTRPGQPSKDQLDVEGAFLAVMLGLLGPAFLEESISIAMLKHADFNDYRILTCISRSHLHCYQLSLCHMQTTRCAARSRPEENRVG